MNASLFLNIDRVSSHTHSCISVTPKYYMYSIHLILSILDVCI